MAFGGRPLTGDWSGADVEYDIALKQLEGALKAHKPTTNKRKAPQGRLRIGRNQLNLNKLSVVRRGGLELSSSFAES